MKKILFILPIILLIFLFNVFTASFVNAQIGDLEGIQEKLDELPSDQDEAKDAATEYLKQEWTKILERYKFGKILLEINKVFAYLNPMFKLFLGIGYSLSFLFFIILALWIFFVSYFYRVSTFLSVFIKFKLFKLILFILSISLVSFFRISNLMAVLFTNKVSNIDSFFYQALFASVFIFLFIILSLYSKKLENIFSSIKEKREYAGLKKELKQEKKEIKQLKKDNYKSEEVEGGKSFLRAIYRAFMEKE